MRESQKLIFKFESENHTIDLKALIDGFGGFCRLLYLLNQTSQDTAEIDIKVEAIRPGSFEISIELWEVVTMIAGTVVLEDKFQWTINSLWKLLSQFLKLAKVLDGEKADKVEQISDSTVSITKGNENHTVNIGILNIYKHNPHIPDTLASSSRAVLSDGSINGWTVEKPAPDGSIERISADKDDIRSFSKKSAYAAEGDAQIVQIYNAVLKLKTVRVDCSGKWQFTYKRRKIEVEIRDINFLDRVRNNEIRFGNGDVFLVDMEVKQTYSYETDSWHDKSYAILRVLNHESTAGRESNLFDQK